MESADKLELVSMQMETSSSEVRTPVLMNMDSESTVDSSDKGDVPKTELGSEIINVTGEGKVAKMQEIDSDMDSVDVNSEIGIVIERTECDTSNATRQSSPTKQPDLNDSKVDIEIPSKMEHETIISPKESSKDINNQNVNNSDKALNAETAVNINVKIEPVDIDVNNVTIHVKGLSAVDESEHPSVSSRTDLSSLVIYSSSSSSSSSSSEEDSDSEESEDEVAKEKKTETKGRGEESESIPQPPKTKKELMFEDLPTVPYVDFRLADNEEISLLGKVSSIIGQLVVVGSLKDTPALNEETVLFGKNRHPIGVVFEIFGPVLNPFYTVRFNSSKDIVDLGLSLNDDVYFAPRQEEITKYVFVRELRAMKGSDASWANDEEPPRECLDYSDDEQERSAKKKKSLGDGKRKDARIQNENGQPERKGQEGSSRRPGTHGPSHNQNNSRGHHHQYRGPPQEHQNQHRSFNQRGSYQPSQRYPQHQGPVRHHRPEWQQGVHHPPPNRNFHRMPSGGFPPHQSNFVPSHLGNGSTEYGVRPPNMYGSHGFQGGPMQTGPPPQMSPYSAPPPYFPPPVFTEFAPHVPPPPPPGIHPY